MFQIATIFCCLITLTLLVYAAWTDRDRRLIPNRVSAVIVALFVIWVVAAHAFEASIYVTATNNLATAGVVFVVGYLLWAIKMLGGGDVKLMTAVSLWAGTQWIAPFIFLTTLVGAGLALLQLALHRLLPHTAICLFGGADDASLLTAKQPAGEPTSSDTTHDDATPTGPTVPYGIAIAVGGGWVIWQIMIKFGT